MAKGPRKRGLYAGWYAEIPRELKEEFVRIYPGRRSIRLFTVAFVSWAIKHRPDIEALNAKWNEDRQLRTNDAPDLSGQVRPADKSGMDSPQT